MSKSNTVVESSSETSSVKTRQCPTFWRGCLAMLAGVFQQMLCWGLIMTHGTILSYYSQHLMPKVSKTLLCLVGAIPGFLLLSLALLWGRLLDAGQHSNINIFAGFSLTLGLVGLAFTGGKGDYGDGKYWAILLASIPMGAGQSCFFLTAPHIAKSWHPKNKGLAMGITNSGAAIGGSIWPIVFTRMTSAHGFAAGVGTLAGISAILCTFIVFAAVPPPNFKPDKIGKEGGLEKWVPLEALKSKVFIVHCAAMCFVYLGILAVPFLIEYWAQQKRLGVSEDDKQGTGVEDHSRDLTVNLVIIMNACQLPGRLFGSTLCDYFHARRVHLVACMTFVALVSVFWVHSTGFGAAAVFAGLFGATLGIMVSLPINDIADILGPSRQKMLGQYAGFVYMIASPFILVGTVIAGVLVDKFRVSHAGVWAAVTIGIGAVFIFLSLVLEDDTLKFDRSPRHSQANSINGSTVVGDELTRQPTLASSVGEISGNGKDAGPYIVVTQDDSAAV